MLRDFAKADQDWLDKLLVAIADAAPLLARGEDSKFMNKVHLTLNPRPPRPKPEEPPVGPQDGV